MVMVWHHDVIGGGGGDNGKHQWMTVTTLRWEKWGGGDTGDSIDNDDV